MSRQLDDWIDGFLLYTDNTEPKESYRRWTAISTIAAALQRKCKLVWGREVFYPNLFVVLVGPPAARKGTAMKEGRWFLDALGLPVGADEASRQKLIKRMMNEVTEDASGRHSSLTIFSPELTVFLHYKNSNEEMLSMLCDWFDCRDRFIYDTLTRGEEEISNVWLNLFGATTPGQIQASLPDAAFGSGLTSRIIFVYEEDKEKVVVIPILTSEEDQLREELLIDLGEVRQLCGEFKYAKSFYDLYAEWRQRDHTEQVMVHPRLEYYHQRRQVHLLKLSMIFCASRSDSMMLSDIDFHRAIGTMELAETKMHQVFEGMGENKLASLQNKILKSLKHFKSIKLSVLLHIYHNDTDRENLDKALDTLHLMGNIKYNRVAQVIDFIKED